MGEGSCTWQRKLNLNKDLLMSAQAIYKGDLPLWILPILNCALILINLRNVWQ